MALPADALEQIRAVFDGEGAVADRIAKLREAFPGISLTRCDASDMDTETPVLEAAGCDVYLVDTSEHCARITTHPEAASGLIIAERR